MLILALNLTVAKELALVLAIKDSSLNGCKRT